MSTVLPLPGTGTHSVGGTVGCVLIFRGLVPAVGRDTVIHEPAERKGERNTLRGQGWSKTLLEGPAQGLQPCHGSALLQLPCRRDSRAQCVHLAVPRSCSAMAEAAAAPGSRG